MADFNVSGLDGLMAEIEKMASIPDKVFDDMLQAEAEVVKRAQKSKLATVIEHPTGQLERSISSTEMKRDRSGIPSVHVYPKGKREGEESSNAEVGFIIEYGAPGRGIPPKPWMRPANEESSEAAAEAAEEVYNDWLEHQGI